MKFFSDFFKAIGNCFKAFSVIFEKGLWPYSFVFLFVWILLWVLSLYGLFVLADGVSDWLSSYIDFNSIQLDYIRVCKARSCSYQRTLNASMSPYQWQ